MRPKTSNSDLPKGMIRVRRTTSSGNAWVGFYLNGRDADGRRVKVPLGTDLGEALKNYAHIINQPGKDAHFWRKELQALYRRTKTRAKANSLDFTLSFEDILQMFDKSGHRCVLSGTPFSPEQPERVRFRPWMPSLDRIDPFGPYSTQNSRLVCAYINIAINQFGVEQFVTVAKDVARKTRASRRGVGKNSFPTLATDHAQTQ